jgi:hypothetical protein
MPKNADHPGSGLGGLDSLFSSLGLLGGAAFGDLVVGDGLPQPIADPRRTEPTSPMTRLHHLTP